MLQSKPYLRISPRHDAHLGVATLSCENFLTSKKNREFYKRQRLVFQQQASVACPNVCYRQGPPPEPNRAARSLPLLYFCYFGPPKFRAKLVY